MCKGSQLKIQINTADIESRYKKCGYFVLITNDETLNAEKILEIYKSRDIVERGFRAIKSDMEITPIFHHKDRRIETHSVLVIYGYFLLSLLRAILIRNGIKLSFNRLIKTIKSGTIIEGYFSHHLLKNRKFKIIRPIMQKPVLQRIFHALRIKPAPFEIKKVVMSTNSTTQ